jgi:hypothetical protein
VHGCCDAARLGGFWAAALGLAREDFEDSSLQLSGDDARRQIWVDPVPEPRTVKNRVHLDVDVGDLDGLIDLGATVLREPSDDRTWWPKRAKNRIHWDVETDDVQRLVTHGATVIRVPDDEVPWHVLADPEGNEFCAFTTKSPAEPTG